MSTIPTVPILIQAAQLFNGLSGSTQAGQAVLIREGRILQVGPAAQLRQQVTPETQTVDLGTACLAPGLIDGHTHLSLADNRRPDIR